MTSLSSPSSSASLLLLQSPVLQCSLHVAPNRSVMLLSRSPLSNSKFKCPRIIMADYSETKLLISKAVTFTHIHCKISLSSLSGNFLKGWSEAAPPPRWEAMPITFSLSTVEFTARSRSGWKSCRFSLLSYMYIKGTLLLVKTNSAVSLRSGHGIRPILHMETYQKSTLDSMLW